MNSSFLRKLAVVTFALAIALVLRAEPPDWTATAGPYPSVPTVKVGDTRVFNFSAHDPDGDLIELEVAWKTPSGAVSQVLPWFSVGDPQTTAYHDMNITFNQGPGQYEVWVNARDGDGNVRDPWAHGIPAERVVVNVVNNTPPSMTISASATSIAVNHSVSITASASDPDVDLRYLNIDLIDPNTGQTIGWYGQVNSGNETPPSSDFYDLGGSVGAGSRTLSFSTSVVGTYRFRVAAFDGTGWFHSSSSVTVVVYAPAPTPPPAPIPWAAASVTDTSFLARWDLSANASGYYLDVANDINFTDFLPGYNSKQLVGAFSSWTVAGLQPVHTYYYRVRAYNTAGVSGYSTPVISVTTPSVINGTGTGLVGIYYNNLNFTAPALTRLDSKVDFPWGGGSPDVSMSPETFSVRWIGQVQPRFSESYTFRTNSDDGVRLWVNGVLLIDQWNDHAPTEHPGTPISLVAGQKYDIKLEYYENGGGATIQLKWQSASQGIEIVPASQLYTSFSQGTPQLIYAAGGELEPGILSNEYLYPAGGGAQLPAGTLRNFTTGLTDVKAEIYNYIDGSTFVQADSGGPNGNVDVTVANTPGHYWTIISGQTPTTYGAYEFFAEFTSNAVPIILSPGDASAGYGNSYSGYTVTASNSPTQFFASNLPPGLTINSLSGLISGTPNPTVLGTWTVSLWAQNAAGSGPTKFLQFSIVKGQQTISAFAPIADRDLSSPSFQLNATASSGLGLNYAVLSGPATINGNTVTVSAVGQVVLRASNAGNAFYDAVQQDASFMVTSGTVTVETFVASGVFDVPAGITSVDVLIVGGGGGGGWHGADGGGGGGGGGGVVLLAGRPVIPGTQIAVIVGSGGAGGTGEYLPPDGGGASSFDGVQAAGGGGGGNWNHDFGWNGGSGGGGTDYNNSAGGSGIPGQGNDGGSGLRGAFYVGGGGGGATAAGATGNANNGQGGAGGTGYTYQGVVYGSGGGGGTTGGGATGGVPGANAGTGGSGTIVAASAAANRGGGGGGSGNNNGIGGNGGSGIVIVRMVSGASQLPVITLQPASQTVTANQNVVFTVSATGTGTLTYQWRKGGTALANTGSYSGVNTPTLQIANVGASHAGNYDVVVSNSAGDRYSAVASLTVTNDPAPDTDGDGIPDSIEALLLTNPNSAGTSDTSNATLQLKIIKP